MARGRRQGSQPEGKTRNGRNEKIRRVVSPHDGPRRRGDDDQRRTGGNRHRRADPGLDRRQDGTAETGIDGRNTTWFIAFADPTRPETIAIAVVLQNQSLTGGATAAPIAREVMQALLVPTANP